MAFQSEDGSLSRAPLRSRLQPQRNPNASSSPARSVARAYNHRCKRSLSLMLRGIIGLACHFTHTAHLSSGPFKNSASSGVHLGATFMIPRPADLRRNTFQSGAPDLVFALGVSLLSVRFSRVGTSPFTRSRSPILLIRRYLRCVFLIKMPSNQARSPDDLRVIYDCG
jgi:hypothetical protein